MNTIKTFFDLDAWQEAHSFALAVYMMTKRFPRDELFGLTSQMRRAASSVGANIAEGFARFHFKDKVRFYHQARGSAAEVQSFLALARDLHYIDDQLGQKLIADGDAVGRLINGLIRSIEYQKQSLS